MTSFNKGISNFTGKLKSAMKDANRSGILVIGNIVIDIIKRRTRSGQGVKSGKKIKLKPLSKKYIKFRQRNAGRLSPFASASKSNLTFSGKMLNGLVRVKTQKGILITFDTNRNKEVAGHVSETRPFMDLADDEVAEVTKTFRKYFSALVKSKTK